MKASAGSSGTIEGSRPAGLEALDDGRGILHALVPIPGVTTSGTSGSLAYFWNSAWTAGERGIHSCGRPL